MTDTLSKLVREVPSVIILTPLLQEALNLGAKIDWVEYLSSKACDSPPSPGFIPFTVNEDKAKIPHLHCITPDKLGWAMMVVAEARQVEAFLDYLSRMEDKRVLV